MKTAGEALIMVISDELELFGYHPDAARRIAERVGPAVADYVMKQFNQAVQVALTPEGNDHG